MKPTAPLPTCRKFVRAIALASAMLALVPIFTGCGGFTTALTGGSVPVGASRFSGRVVRGDDITVPVADADVTVAVTVGGRSATKAPMAVRATRADPDDSGGSGSSGGIDGT